jgi:hypothetical protein
VSFRRMNNRHDNWKTLVAENADLLVSLPEVALADESSFRSYVTHGILHGIKIHPTVPELSPEAVDALWTFVNHKAAFDMDASLFDDLNTTVQNRRTGPRASGS